MAEDVKIWFITLSWIILVRWGKLYIRIKLWLQVLTFSLCLCVLIQGSEHFVAEHNVKGATISAYGALEVLRDCFS